MRAQLIILINFCLELGTLNGLGYKKEENVKSNIIVLRIIDVLFRSVEYELMSFVRKSLKNSGRIS